MDTLKEIAVEELLNSPTGQGICRAMDTITAVQRNLFALAASEDSAKLNLLKIGTVFQIFLVDTLAARKNPKDIQPEEWANIANKVSEYAVLEENQCYSEFVFTLYADYIDLSAKSISGIISKESYSSIQSISSEIRSKSTLLREGKIAETAYVEDCLWLSLEAMIKLLSSSLTSLIGKEYSQLAQAVSQLAFEYGRCALLAKEQAILNAYIENQFVLDAQLQERYVLYCSEVRTQSERFQKLVAEAFSPQIHESLIQSAALAREAGVREEEILTSLNEVDSFFLD